MENPDQKIARLDAALAQCYSDLNEALWQLHNLSESCRHLRMMVEVWRAARTAQQQDDQARARRDSARSVATTESGETRQS